MCPVLSPARAPLRCLLAGLCLVALLCLTARVVAQSGVEVSTILGKPAGGATSTGCLQFNQSGRSFACDPALTYDSSTGTLFVPTSLNVGGGGTVLGGRFTQLSDAPSSYSGFGGSCVAVNAGATGLTFVACAEGGSSATLAQGDAFPTAPTSGDLFVVTDDSVPGACNSESGTFRTVCQWDGTQWVPLGVDYIQNIKEDCSGDVTEGLWCKQTNGLVFNGDGSAAVPINAAGTPPGNDTECIFNDGAAFGADAGCLYNKTTNTLTTGAVVVPCDTATAECVNTVPNETASVSEPSTANTCSYAPVNGVWQFRCNAAALRTVATLGVVQDWTAVQTFSGGAKKTPTFGTADTYTMLESECGGWIANTDGDTLEIDLIADPTGCVICVFAETNFAITLDPSGSDSIIISGLTPSTGDSITLAAGIGNNLCLIGKNSTTWFGRLNTGSVTDTN